MHINFLADEILLKNGGDVKRPAPDSSFRIFGERARDLGL